MRKEHIKVMLDENYYKKYEPIFGSWYIKKKIGSGSFGSVYEIEREDFGVKYTAALKTITIPSDEAEIAAYRADGMSDKEINEELYQFAKELVAEFELMAKLKGNSNIVSYEDHKVIEHDDGIGWDILIRMELLTPLVDYIRSNTIRIKDLIKLGMDMCSALELCQKFNIIHRDIKPENIFVSPNGDYKLGDFGIARQIEKTTFGLSKKGTYNYMAPEVYKGQKYGTGVDIYSLGIVLYRLLNQNRVPFMPPYPEKITHTKREKALISRMSGEPFPPPKGLESGRLVEIIMKAAAYLPQDRYSSPVQMREDLAAIQYDYDEYVLFNPTGDRLDIKSLQYVGTGTDENATEVMHNTDDGDGTAVMRTSSDDSVTELMTEGNSGKKKRDKKHKQNHVTSGTEKQKNKKKVIIAAIIAALAVSGIGIYAGVHNSSRNEEEQEVVMKIEESSALLPIGESKSIKELAPDNSYYSNTKYVSDDNSIVTVDESGILTAAAEGTATITCDSDTNADGKDDLEVKVKVTVGLSQEEIQAVEAKKNELIGYYNISYNVLKKVNEDSTIDQNNVKGEKDILEPSLQAYADLIDKARRLQEMPEIEAYYNSAVKPASDALDKAYGVAYNIAHPPVAASSGSSSSSKSSNSSSSSKSSSSSSNSSSSSKSSSNSSSSKSSGSSSSSKSSGSSSSSKSSSSGSSYTKPSSGSGSNNSTGSGSSSSNNSSSGGSNSNSGGSNNNTGGSEGSGSQNKTERNQRPKMYGDFLKP